MKIMEKNKTNEILEMLTQNELTTSEIRDKTNYDLNLIQVIINRLKNANKIIKIGNKGKFVIYKALETDKIDKNMNNRLLQDKIDKTSKILSLFREMFEKGVIKVYKEKMTIDYQKCLEEL